MFWGGWWEDWVWIKGQTNNSDSVVGVCYRPPDHEEEADEAFDGELEVNWSQAPVLQTPWYLLEEQHSK